MKKALFVSILTALMSLNLNAAERSAEIVSWTFASYDEIKDMMLASPARDALVIAKKGKQESGDDSGIVYGELGW